MSNIEDPEDLLEVTPPKTWATGLPAVTHAMQYSLGQTSVRRTALTLLNINQTKGFDCPGCAWPEPGPGHRAKNEYCENGAKHINDEATSRRVTADFFREHSVSELGEKSDYWLNQQGRLTEPMVKRPGADHYEPIGWDDALALLAEELRRLDSPDEALFYTSGRLNNEAAFLLQLFARAYGTNNLPDCSNMCHESSGSALQETLGIGKGSVSLDDIHHSDLVFVVGQNPGTNHPRMLSALEETKRNGGHIVDAKVFVGVAGNFVRATPDSEVTERAMRRCRLTAHISTKLNRSHTVCGGTALILPTLGRSDRDIQAGGEQFITVEDSMSEVHASRGRLHPASPHLLSEVAIISRLARRTLGDRPSLPWEKFEADYGTIRDRISRVVPGFEDFNSRVARPGGFRLPNPVNEGVFPTPSGKAVFTRNDFEMLRAPRAISSCRPCARTTSGTPFRTP